MGADVFRVFDRVFVIERRQTDFRKMSSDSFEHEWEIKFRNHKERPVEIEVIEQVPGYWHVPG